MSALRVADVMNSHPVIASASMLVSDFIDRKNGDRRNVSYPVVDIGGSVIGMITVAQALRVPAPKRISTPIAEVVLSLQQVPVASPYDSLVSVVKHMDPQNSGTALVLDQGHLVGIVTASDIARGVGSRGLSRSNRQLVP